MKKFLSCLILVAMLLSLCACASGEPNDKMYLDYLYNTGAGHEAIGTYLQQALHTMGITVQLKNQEWNTFLSTRKNGHYVIARNGWVADYNDPICFLDLWTSDSGNNDVQFGKGAHASLKMYDLDLTAFGYDVKVEDGTWSETYDVLIRTIKNCTVSETRYAMMHLAEDMLMDTGCITPIYYYTDPYMLDDSVTGFYTNPLGYKFFMYTKVNGKTDTISVCLASEPASLDPAKNSALDGATMISHMFSGLAKWIEVDGEPALVADCAKELVKPVINADGTATYTYTLKDGLTWSNGSPVKASDFVYAWNRAASPATGADYGYMFEVVDGYKEMYEENAPKDAKLNAIADDAAGTITVTLKNQVPYWDELLAFPTYFPVCKDVVEQNSKWATKAATYVCNGAYTMDSWTNNSVIVLKKNDSYHDAANVTMEEIKCYLSDDVNAMLNSFKNGSWQLIDDVPNNEIITLQKEYPTEYKVAPQIGTYYVSWNINANLLPESSTLTGVEAERAQAEIRKAVSLLLDREYIVEYVAQGGEIAASTFVALGLTDADGSQFYQNASPAPGKDYYGYFDTSREAFSANAHQAATILAKYYENIVTG